MAKGPRSSSAAPQTAAHILQLDRCLFQLSKADHDVSVAVEYFDDVSLSREMRPILHEQDKNSLQTGKDALEDRSMALWRTLEIWLFLLPAQHGGLCDRHLLVTNTIATGKIASSIKAMQSGTGTAREAVVALRNAGVSKSKSKSKSKIQTKIDTVLASSDEELEALLRTVEVVDGFDVDVARKEMANGFAIDPRVDITAVLDSLLGWVTSTLRDMWRAQEPGVISRRAAILQCRVIEERLARQRFMPKPAGDIHIAEGDIDRALARPFVDHLSRIEAAEDEIIQAIEHFIQFNVEKHRLTAEGEIPIDEWRHRAARLGERWTNIARRTKRELTGQTRQHVGQQIWMRSTFEHHEPLAGQPCHELYMTSGHYHRLADEHEVWWDPTFLPTSPTP